MTPTRKPITLADIAREFARIGDDPGWSRIPPPPAPPALPVCDLCGAKAIWQHPAGGFRCRSCPRPIR